MISFPGIITLSCLLIAGCAIHYYEPVEVPEDSDHPCDIEETNSKVAWTVIDFDYFEQRDRLDSVCPAEDTYPNFQPAFRDLQTFKDMCIKHEALSEKDASICKKTQTCFIRTYCEVELKMLGDPDYCKTAQEVDKDFCILIDLRDNHGYTPGYSADCSDLTSPELIPFCSTAYSRKE